MGTPLWLLLTQSVALLEKWVATGAHGTAEFADTPDLLRAATQGNAGGRIPSMVSQCLSTSVAADDADPIVHTLRQCAPELRWQHTKQGYGGDDFRLRYAYNVLVSPPDPGWPRSSFHCQGARAGFTVQEANVYYPPHHHPAFEVYVILSGVSQWCRGDEGWRMRVPGDVIFHDSRVSHGMRTEDQPLVAFYAWVGEIEAFPQMDGLDKDA